MWGGGRRMYSPRRIYVGNLPRDVQKMEVLELFDKFGRICFADLKGGRTGPPFAFIEFQDPRDAEDAISQRDGFKYDGCRLRVEFPKGEMRNRGFPPPPEHNNWGRGNNFYPFNNNFDYNYNNNYNNYNNNNNNRRYQQRRSQYRLLVSGLPPGATWQDLKDHMREVGEVVYAEVRRDGSGTGIVEFLHRDDMREAIRKFNDTPLRDGEGNGAHIRLREYGVRSRSPLTPSPKQRRHRSPSLSRSRSPPGPPPVDEDKVNGEMGSRRSRS